MSQSPAQANHGNASWHMHAALMLTMMMWALNVSLIKWLVDNMDAALSAGLRMLGAALALVVLLAISVKQWRLFNRRMLALLSISALLMVYANQMLFVSAMPHTTASNASLVLALNPLLTGVLEAFFFKKRLHRQYLLGVAIALVGVCLVIFNNPKAQFGEPSWGDLMVLGSMLAFALGVMVLQYLSQRKDDMLERPTQLGLNTFIYVIGSLALLLHAGFSTQGTWAQLSAISWPMWGVIGASGILITALGALAWGKGVANIGAGRAGIYMSWVPLMGVGFGAWLLDEALTIWHLYALIAVVVGTALCNTSPKTTNS